MPGNPQSRSARKRKPPILLATFVIILGTFVVASNMPHGEEAPDTQNITGLVNTSPEDNAARLKASMGASVAKPDDKHEEGVVQSTIFQGVHPRTTPIAQPKPNEVLPTAQWYGKESAANNTPVKTPGK